MTPDIHICHATEGTFAQTARSPAKSRASPPLAKGGFGGVKAAHASDPIDAPHCKAELQNGVLPARRPAHFPPLAKGGQGG